MGNKLNFIKIVGLSVLFLICIIYIMPLIWLFDSSFRPMIEIFQIPPMFIKKGISSFSSYSLNSFINAFTHWGVFLSLINSILVTTSTIILTMIICSLASYAFAFYDFPGKNIIFYLILATMMLPLVTMIAPYYKVLQKLGLTNNLLGLIIPYSASALCVFLLRQFFINIPRSLIEAGTLDGAGKLRIWGQIIMPLSKPAIAALSIIQFREVWNDFLIPMIVLRNDNLFTLPIKLQLMDSQTFNKPYDAIIATGFITTIIPVVFFLIFQRQFINGLTGGVKQ
jgi:putative chitobiose transport system permease protein